MAEEPKKSKGFNAYWIYAIIAVLLISFNLVQFSDNDIEIEESDFYELAERGYIEKLTFIKNQEIGEIYLKPESIDSVKAMDEKYKSLTKKEGIAGRSPDLTFITPDVESFEDDQEKHKERL